MAKLQKEIMGKKIKNPYGSDFTTFYQIKINIILLWSKGMANKMW